MLTDVDCEAINGRLDNAMKDLEGPEMARARLEVYQRYRVSDLR
jgi:hypothetical protein